MWFTLKKQKSKKDAEFDKYGSLSNSNRVSYTSPLIQKLHPYGGVTSKTYKPTFLTTHLMAVLQLLGIPSSTVEILLFNLVFHDGVTPVSVSTLKPLLGIIGVLPLKPRASPILSVCI